MRKHLFSATAFVMAFVMVFALLPQSVTVSAAFGDDERVFDDVPVNHWAADAIAQAVSAGYVNGYTDGTFKPDQEVTREEFLTMAVRAFELDFEKYTHTLWSMPYIMAAVEQGWIKPDQYSNDVEKITKYKHIERGNIAATMYLNGEPVTVFASTSNFPMNRAEMAQVAVMATNLDEDTDMDNTHEVMYTAVKNGIIAGTGKGDLAPNDTTTRAQAVVVIERILAIQNGETLPNDHQALLYADFKREHGDVPIALVTGHIHDIDNLETASEFFEKYKSRRGMDMYDDVDDFKESVARAHELASQIEVQMDIKNRQFVVTLPEYDRKLNNLYLRDGHGGYEYIPGTYEIPFDREGYNGYIMHVSIGDYTANGYTMYKICGYTKDGQYFLGEGSLIDNFLFRNDNND